MPARRKTDKHVALWGQVKLVEDLAPTIAKFRTSAKESDWWRATMPSQIRHDSRYRDFLDDPRCIFIPGSADMGIDTSLVDGMPTKACSRVEHGVWTFACSVLNSERTFEKFLAILPLIAEKWELRAIREDAAGVLTPDIHRHGHFSGRLVSMTIAGYPIQDNPHDNPEGYGSFRVR